ncbi:MAG: glycogen synthase [Candidatus Omnitrophica bacterium]|nr:glycogen synthase [Candidatus Omnitrophota bacterium]
MKILLLTNEYPPAVYGGAGIHVDYLSRELAKLCKVDVRCFGNQRFQSTNLCVTGFPLNNNGYSAPVPLRPVFGAIQRCLDFNTTAIDADIVHAHTWYTHLAGIMAKQNYSIPLVVTTHSLEPLRPWKREQLAGGYDFSCWVEKTAIEMADAVIAVSQETKNDILKLYNVESQKIHIIHNGIDLNEYHRVSQSERLAPLGIDPDKPYVLFVGRITRQKGIIHLVNAINHMDRDFQVVLCAGAPDTPEIAVEMKTHVSAIQKTRNGVIWIPEMLDTPTKVALYSHAALFACPSIYEPFGIINLEAMACEVPIVASAVGGIKEVVTDNDTGILVPVEQGQPGTFEPKSPEKFERAFAEKINFLMKNPDLRAKMGQAGRKRAVNAFSWSSIAQKTHTLYQSLL